MNTQQPMDLGKIGAGAAANVKAYAKHTGRNLLFSILITFGLFIGLFPLLILAIGDLLGDSALGVILTLLTVALFVPVTFIVSFIVLKRQTQAKYKRETGEAIDRAFQKYDEAMFVAGQQDKNRAPAAGTKVIY